MKNLTFLLLGGLLFLASCSTGNMASFSKRKYTKGKYKPEKNDYKVSKDKNKSEDTKYAVTSEKHKNKQSYRVSKKKVNKKEEVAVKKNNIAVNSATTNEKVVEESPVYAAKNNNSNTVVEDGIVDTKPVDVDPIISETNETANPTPAKAPASVGAILGYVGFGVAMFALLMGLIGFIWPLMWLAIFFGLAGLGLSIASMIIDGKTAWNFWGIIGASVAILLGIIFLILAYVGIFII